MSDNDLENHHLEFLRSQLHTHNINHVGTRPLFDHLKGTRDLLKIWGNPAWVVRAGLYHSIYGTRIFRHQSFPIEKREVIRDLIGERAEMLAYSFCVCGRPDELLKIAETDAFQADTSNFEFYSITDYILNESMVVDKATVLELLEIEAANLVDQNCKNRKLLKRICNSGIKSETRQAIVAYIQAFSTSSPSMSPLPANSLWTSLFPHWCACALVLPQVPRRQSTRADGVNHAQADVIRSVECVEV